MEKSAGQLPTEAERLNWTNRGTQESSPAIPLRALANAASVIKFCFLLE